MGLRKKGIVVLGISKDSVKSHSDFIEKYSLPFTLLSDTNKKVIRQYGAWRKNVIRISYLISPTSYIKRIYPKVNPKKHAEEILSDITLFSN